MNCPLPVAMISSRIVYSLHFALIISAVLILLPAMALSLGINYGQIADNLPSPEKVVPLVKSIGVTRVKLYDANPSILKAFADTDIEFMVCIPNEILTKMTDPKQAQDWIKRKVQPYLPATKITAIIVGNEILSNNNSDQTESLLPAMQSVHTALVNLRLDKQIAVTTTHPLSILETSYPPSAGKFRQDLADSLCEMLSFLMNTSSPFLINAYPYFAYKASPKQVSLDFVLFQPNQGIVDPSTNLHYDNMLFAQIDAVYSALASLGFDKVPVHISETGWPSKGDTDEAGATPDNAKKYNGNLIKIIAAGKGTPMRPDTDLNIFVFALFNEDLKPGPTSERNFGLFKPDGTPAYSLGVSTAIAPAAGNSSGGDAATSGGGEGGYALQPPPFPSPSPPTGYLAISFATERKPAILLAGLVVGLLSVIG